MPRVEFISFLYLQSFFSSSVMEIDDISTFSSLLQNLSNNDPTPNMLCSHELKQKKNKSSECEM